MKLQDLKLSEFLPQYMQSDETAKAFEYAVQRQILKVISEISNLKIYISIDTQPESVLDELGWQFNIPEYASTLPIDAKRNLVKTAITTHRRRGTVAAVRQVVTDIFGDARLEEWFEYGGKPYYFKVYASNVTTVEQALLFKSIASSQNVRSILEAIIIKLIFENTLYFGSVVQVADIVNVFTNSNVGFNSINFAFVTQIADTVNVFTPANIKDKQLFIANAVQIADFITINEVI